MQKNQPPAVNQAVVVVNLIAQNKDYKHESGY